MSQKVLFIKLLLVHYATQSQIDIQERCNVNVSLTCSGVDIDSMKFVSVTWYKLNNHRKNGIIRRSKDEKSTQHFNFTRFATFGEKHSLFLPSVMPDDSGTYECAIGARIGGQNQNFRVNLTVHACVTQTDLTTMTNVLNSTQDLPCHKHVEDLPAMWSIIGYVAVALTKIILSLSSIWVIEAIRGRS